MPVQNPEPHPLASTSARSIIDQFGRHIADLLKHKREAGVVYSTIGHDGEVVFVHPDGSTRETPLPDSRIVG